MWSILEELFGEIARDRLICCHLDVWLDSATQWSFTGVRLIDTALQRRLRCASGGRAPKGRSRVGAVRPDRLGWSL
jgi:hypothetical protein